jgi:hypothetical protein
MFQIALASPLQRQSHKQFSFSCWNLSMNKAVDPPDTG